MESEGSLPESQVSATCPYPEPKYQSRSEDYSLTVSQYTSLRWGVVSTPHNSQAWEPPLVGCPWLLIQYICSYPPYWSLFLHLQPVDAPCRGDRNPLMNISLKIWIAQKAQNFLCGWVELGIGFSAGFLLHSITKPSKPWHESDVSILGRPVGHNLPSVWQER